MPANTTPTSIFSLPIDLTLALIFLTIALIVLTGFLVYYTRKALFFMSHTDKLIKAEIGGSFSNVVELRKDCFENPEEVIKKIKEKPKMWAIEDDDDSRFSVSYYLHSEEDLEKLLTNSSKNSCMEEIRKDISFYRKL